MATAGMELRWPVLFPASNVSHVLEPMAQVFARDRRALRHGRLGIPNEDAQSFVFDATTLFERDKFSGYDRIEGGTRANVGLRYSGSFGNGWTTNALFGQSYHLAGENSFASPDLVNVGAYSGLETDTSDYVGLVGFATPIGLSASASAGASTSRPRSCAGPKPRPATRPSVFGSRRTTPSSRRSRSTASARIATSLSFGASTQLHENWRAFGSGTYDFENAVLVKSSHRASPMTTSASPIR